MKRALLLALLFLTIPAWGTTWYVRPDGAGIYDAARTSTFPPQGPFIGPAIGCNGKADVSYAEALLASGGAIINLNCAVSDLRYLYDDQTYQNHAWIIAPGDTVIIRGCADGPANTAPQCRIGWNYSSYLPVPGFWCYGLSNNACGMPVPPSGTPSAHTRILGQNYANCTSQTQIFGGFGVTSTIDLSGAQYIDIQCVEIFRGHSQCISHGSPAYPSLCSASPPFDDYTGNGILTSNTTGNILLQDVYIHGNTNSGIQGPIGGPWALTRVQLNINGFAGWNFDDGKSTPNGPGSSITANQVTMMYNGCNEQYPHTTAVPLISCYDLSSGGFGDSWSGQNANLDSFVCNRCVQAYNTKDGFIGPHTLIKTLTITNSASYGNMGQQWKWVTQPNSTTTFTNNLTIGNCHAMSTPLPGAPADYNQYLGLFCRAAGDVFSFSSDANSTVLLADNTVVAYSNTIFDLNCVTPSSCNTTPFTFTNNLILGYTMPTGYFPGANGQAPGLYFRSDGSDVVTASHMLEFGVRNGDPCGGTIMCTDPLFTGEPAQGSIPPESSLLKFDFYPSSLSSAIGHATPLSAVTTDYNGNPRPGITPTIGAFEPLGIVLGSATGTLRMTGSLPIH